MSNKVISPGLATTLILTLWAGSLMAQTFSIDIPSPGIAVPVPGDSIHSRPCGSIFASTTPNCFASAGPRPRSRSGFGSGCLFVW